MSLTDARVFVSDFVLTSDTDTYALQPKQDLPFQDATWALLDFEDATEGCSATGTAATNTRVVGAIPEGHWKSVSFTVGLPHGASHAVAGASPPLDDAATFRTVQLGRLAMKIDLRREGGAAKPSWPIRIGPEDCSSGAANQAPESPCLRPAAARVTVPWRPFDTEKRPVIALDLAALLVGVDLSEDAYAPEGCQGAGTDTFECAPVFAALGMSFATGDCVDGCSNHAAFRTVCERRSDGSEIDCL